MIKIGSEMCQRDSIYYCYKNKYFLHQKILEKTQSVSIHQNTTVKDIYVL